MNDYFKKIVRYLFSEHKVSLFVLLILPILNAYFISSFFPKFNAYLNQNLLLNNLRLSKQIFNKLAMVTIILQFVRYLQRYYLTKFLTKINFDLKNISMWYFLNLPLNTINIEKYGEKINKLVNNILEFLHIGITLIYKTFFTCLIGIITMIYFNKDIGKLFFLFLIVFIVLFPLIFNKSVIKSYYLSKEEINMNLFIEDISRNYFYEKLFNLKEFTYNMFLKLLKKETKAVNSKYSALGNALLQSNLLISVTSVIFSIINIYFLNIPPAKKIVIFGLTNAFFMNFNEIPQFVIPLFNNLGAIKEGKELLDADLEEEKPFMNIMVDSIELENVTFYYVPSKIILEDINICFKKGLNIIDGVSGKGKTTIVKLITGLLEPKKGTVSFNEIDIKEHNVLENISYMPQADGIYNRSVMDNINLNQDAVFIFDKIKEFKMDNILQQNCGINGQNISGGENRRISLLRMLNFYKEGNIVIFDEPFVGLNEELTNFMIDFILSFKDNIVIVIDHTHLLYKYNPVIFSF